MGLLTLSLYQFNAILITLVVVMILLIIVFMAICDERRYESQALGVGLSALLIFIGIIVFSIITPSRENMTFIELDQIKQTSPEMYKCDMESAYCRSKIWEFKEDSLKTEIKVEEILNQRKLKEQENASKINQKIKLDSLRGATLRSEH